MADYPTLIQDLNRTVAAVNASNAFDYDHASTDDLIRFSTQARERLARAEDMVARVRGTDLTGAAAEQTAAINGGTTALTEAIEALEAVLLAVQAETRRRVAEARRVAADEAAEAPGPRAVRTGQAGIDASFEQQRDPMGQRNTRDAMLDAVARLRRREAPWEDMSRAIGDAGTYQANNDATAMFVGFHITENKELFEEVGNKTDNNVRMGFHDPRFAEFDWKGKPLSATLARGVLKAIWKRFANMVAQYDPGMARKVCENIPGFMIGNSDPALHPVIREACLLAAMRTDPLWRKYTDEQKRALMDEFLDYRETVSGIQGQGKDQIRERIKMRECFNTVYTGEVTARAMAVAMFEHQSAISKEMVEEAMRRAFGRATTTVANGGVLAQRANKIPEAVYTNDASRRETERHERTARAGGEVEKLQALRDLLAAT